MLQDFGWCWINFENGQIFVTTFLDVARCCARLASSFSMLRAFGRALKWLKAVFLHF